MWKIAERKLLHAKGFNKDGVFFLKSFARKRTEEALMNTLFGSFTDVSTHKI
mgnify:FL=1